MALTSKASLLGACSGRAQLAGIRPAIPAYVVHKRRVDLKSAQSEDQKTNEEKEAYRREFRSLGSQVIETSDGFENPPDKDMWEDPKWESLGQFGEKYFLPTLLVLGLVCGGIAAGTYNSGADTYIKAAPGPEETMRVIPAESLQSPPQ
mmetsp:Transcript_23839/g.61887  ORF Transcript_23839/g.61887 Transcript_23839/m.61887 type:complete len:149 (+) Transcript_23839:1780-2226(+)|eukprot:CAMPEP_0202405286 /NCGR_PEP_ID=MMETSP1128-20130828/6738_1 /ASSEMBLY_ACC=CAM_ASM_000463 /TAXON_ID=3047 /ORGANISM="Dunaliella tertiolecta, Strain CCMP1320" /LENGTH=148 /DNA_ID=CAMNT_0049009947 /DNA_START=29 /DNA_END=475 /DNA_ORIENTATION=+